MLALRERKWRFSFCEHNENVGKKRAELPGRNAAPECDILDLDLGTIFTRIAYPRRQNRATREPRANRVMLTCESRLNLVWIRVLVVRIS